jgi:type IV pilus assembly protein PilX
MNCKSAVRVNRETGAVLVTAMLLLLVMTIIGVSATSTTVMQEKMSSNTRQSKIAFQAAEVALRSGEDLFASGFGAGSTALTRNNLGTLFNGTDPGLYSRLTTTEIGVDLVSFDVYDPSLWNGANSIQGQAILASLSNAPPAPRFIIEYVGRIGDLPTSYTIPDARKYAFRITAIGWGQELDAAGNRISRVLSSTFKTAL